MRISAGMDKKLGSKKVYLVKVICISLLPTGIILQLSIALGCIPPMFFSENCVDMLAHTKFFKSPQVGKAPVIKFLMETG